MTVSIYEFPSDWYQYVVSRRFRAMPASQVSPRPWSGGRNVSGPHAKWWTATITFAPLQDPLRQDVEAFFSRLDGQAQVLRMADPSRLYAWRNRLNGDGTFSDGATFSDGSSFTINDLPAEVIVTAAAARGAHSISLGGFDVSSVNMLRRGDLLQIKPSGVAGTIPHLYEVMVGGDTDASGEISVEISPRLRAGIAVNDTVNLDTPATLFRLTDDTQGEMQVDGAGIGSLGFTAVEALDLVP